MDGIGVLRLFVVLSVYLALTSGNFRWQKYDNYDKINDLIMSVNGENCHSKSRANLLMNKDVVSQIPKYNELLSKVFYKNRTSLIHLHNMALNRAFFYSYMLQKFNTSKYDFQYLPNWMYMYMSAVADVNANPFMINGSAIWFDTNCTYPNWLLTYPFNKTIPLFAPAAWRWNDFRDSDNYLRETTRQAVMIKDFGAGHSNYTHQAMKMNPWYYLWQMPDFSASVDSITKYSYSVGFKYSNITGEFINTEYQTTSFFGPAQPGQYEKDIGLPVLFTQPYFDCGKSNQWIVSAVSPVIDYMVRYSNWTHLRRPRIVALITMDINFKRIDFNSCPVSIGNPGPSYLSGISRCRRTTTSCKHKPGFGFKRGGYVCNCRAGYRYPVSISPPYHGEEIELSTEDEYYSGFSCTRTDFRHVLPLSDNAEDILMADDIDSGYLSIPTWNKGDKVRRSAQGYRTDDHRSRRLKAFNDTVLKMIKNVNNFDREQRGLQRKPLSQALRDEKEKEKSEAKYQYPQKRRKKRRKILSRKKRSPFDQKSLDRVQRIFRQIGSVTPSNCASKLSHHLLLPGDVAFGVDDQFETQARTALRLAHFLSNFLQNSNPEESFGIHKGGQKLHQEYLFAEVLSNVMADFRILSAGVFFDTNQFTNHENKIMELFGPWAFRTKGTFSVIDASGLPTKYTNKEWFVRTKERWKANSYGLKTYKMRAFFRSDFRGSSSIPFEYFPLTYKAPALSDGSWSRPHYRCDGRVDQWVMTYVVPFFGLDKYKVHLKFKGVTMVDVSLKLLEINQCPQPFYVANAFKNTALCPFTSTNCVRLAGYGFSSGAYKCNCKQGFEYVINDKKYWIQGSLLENEYLKKKKGIFSRYDSIACRVSLAITRHCKSHVLLLLVTLCYYLFP